MVCELEAAGLMEGVCLREWWRQKGESSRRVKVLGAEETPWTVQGKGWTKHTGLNVLQIVPAEAEAHVG